MEKSNKDVLIKNIGEIIYSLFFERDFGLATKGEIESAVFNAYVNYKRDCGEDYSDRQLSRQLGISEAKVKNLKRICYARYGEEINFPDLLTRLADKGSALMFFKAFNNNQQLLCRITVKEVVYYDELRAQLTNCGIQFSKKPGSNYVELTMFDAIKFFSQVSIYEGSDELSELVAKMKADDFKNGKEDVIKGMVNDSKYKNTIMALWNWAKNSRNFSN